VKKYIGHSDVSSIFPVHCIQDELFSVEQIIDVRHELGKILLPPARGLFLEPWLTLLNAIVLYEVAAIL
jgi:hypothetical protein